MPDRNRPSPTGGNDAPAVSGAALAGLLADTCVLMGATQALHWNGAGPAFHAVHELTGMQYREMFEALDTLAERMRALRVRAPSGLAQTLQLASLDPDAEAPGLHAGISRLGDDHATLAARARELSEQAGDAATRKILVARAAAHEKAAWLLRGHLTRAPSIQPPTGDS